MTIENSFEHFKKLYNNHLLVEKRTTQKILWREQKKVYEEVLKSDNPLESFKNLLKLNKTVHQIASERLCQN